MRERDLIRNETFCNPDFATCAVAEGTGIRVELSLDEIEDIQGYVAAEANHTKNAKRRKEFHRLFDKLQVFLDTYDDQSEKILGMSIPLSPSGSFLKPLCMNKI